jgi:miniconductance mechanosensitive channel
MDFGQFQQWIEENPIVAFGAIIVFSVALFFITRVILSRGLLYITRRTDTRYDDIIVKNLHPYRAAWIAPLIVIYSFANLVPDYQTVLEIGSLFFILWVSAFTINAIITSINEIYETNPGYTGVSIQSYLDIAKIIIILVSVILSVSLITGESPIVLLTGLGALTAVLLLVFRDTILSLVASIQISTLDLVKEGDWVEVPSFGADGDVIDMSLHSIKIQNFDKTITVIPTHKIIEGGYKNWRGMQDSGGRRIKRSIFIDLASIKFCDESLLERFQEIDLLKDYMTQKRKEIEEYNLAHGYPEQSGINGRQLTNIGTFRAYMKAYLHNHESIHKEGMSFLIRQLAPGPKGLPMELYAFTKTTVWSEYEAIQADIFDHLLAAVSSFDLRVFQEPTGLDFAAFGSLNKN